MAPSDAVDDKLVNFLLTTLKEPLVVLRVIVVITILPLLLFGFSFGSGGVRVLIFFFVQSCQQSDDRFEQEQDVVVAMDLEFLKEGSSEVSLVRKFLHERAPLVNLLEIINHADLLATVHLLVVLEQLVDDLIERALTIELFCRWSEGVITLFFLIFV